MCCIGPYHPGKYHKNFRFRGDSQAGKMIWYGRRSTTHCYWSVSKSCLNAYLRRAICWMHLLATHSTYWAVTIIFYCQKATETPDLGSTLSLETGMTGDKESHPLHLKYCKTLLVYIWYVKKLWEASVSLECVTLGHILQEIPPKLTRFRGGLSAWRIGWYGTRRAIHCYWSISNPCLNTYVKRVEFVKASACPSCVILWHNHQAL